MTADVLFNLKNQQWEKIQELYDKSLIEYEVELNIRYDEGNDELIADSKNSIAQLYLKKGKTYEKMKLVERAIEMYDESLDYDPTSSLTYLRIGWAHVRQNRVYEGYNYLKKGISYK